MEQPESETFVNIIKGLSLQKHVAAIDALKEAVDMFSEETSAKHLAREALNLDRFLTLIEAIKTGKTADTSPFEYVLTRIEN